jgi:hypothetical protein
MLGKKEECEQSEARATPVEVLHLKYPAAFAPPLNFEQSLLKLLKPFLRALQICVIIAELGAEAPQPAIRTCVPASRAV